MDEVKDDAFKGVAERLTLGITRILENMAGVADVCFTDTEPAEKRSLLSWEQKNTCILPEDLRDFYLTTDGLSLTWNVKLDNESVPLGCVRLNCVSRLCPLVSPVSLFSLPNAPSLCDLDQDDKEPESSPHFDSRSRIFELDSSGGNGKVCLVYKNCTPGVVAQNSEVWFLDRSLKWHFLTSSFTSYYRLMITHMGLPEWHSSFTPYGPSPQAQWASLYQPLTFADPQEPPSDPHLNRLDPSRAFRTKTKTPPKKKPSAQSGATGTGRAAAGRGGAKR
ncbi:tubulin polyglutamylase complex subunit 2 isoform X2 [Eucyclogobius newberryi]|uniref:tubulin polyglutamylase complex subunit 2 isoform X2 n=1 Tax=Eucyclogobius newberryi TaxID=166745 RepID=UPI003B5B3844